MKSFMQKMENLAFYYPRSFTAVYTIVILVLAASLARCEKAPESFLGFDRGENAVDSRAKIASLKVIDSGRMKDVGLPFIMVSDYVTPDGAKCGLLILTFTDTTFPRLVGVAASHGTVTPEQALSILKAAESRGAVIEKSSDSIKARRKYENAEFTVGVLADMTLVSTIVWKEVR